MLRRIVVAASAAALMFLTSGAAHAGGSWLEPSWVRVEPGDELSLTATVYRGQLGWVDDGPFFAYLQGDQYGVVVRDGLGGAATRVMLGQLVISEQSDSLTVSVVTTIPPGTPPGEYWVTVCNDPCTKGLGDLIGGVLYVSVDPPDDPGAVSIANITATSIPPQLPTQLAVAPYPDRTTEISPLWVGFVIAVGGGVLLMAVFGRDRA